LGECIDSALNFGSVLNRSIDHFYRERGSSQRNGPQQQTCVRRRFGTIKNCDANELRGKFFQDFKPLASDQELKIGDSSYVAAWSS
jgi:hypothetical protein